MEDSKIEWTDHTFNPWIGCTKVNALCALCYAETMMDKRYKRVVWGPTGTRVRTAGDNWRKPIRWNKTAEQEETRRRVFCASLADVYEERKDLNHWRQELFQLIRQTPHLDWLTLTKRPENIGGFWGVSDSSGTIPEHVWLGTSVGTQQTAEELVPRLVQWRSLVPILFLSAEPLLERVKLPLAGIDWVIVGGESGGGARPMEEAWVLDVKDQCEQAGVAFFFKQWGGVNKKRRGRTLLGREWNELPDVGGVAQLAPTQKRRRHETN